MAQELIFSWREVDRLFAYLHLVHFVIQHHIMEGHHPWFGPFGRPGDATQNCLQTDFDFTEGERFANIIIGAQAKTIDNVIGAVQGRKHDNRHIALLAQFGAEGKAVDLRHHHIQQHQVDLMGFKKLARFPAIAGGDDLIANFLERDLQQFAEGIFIFGNKNPHFALRANLLHIVKHRGNRPHTAWMIVKVVEVCIFAHWSLLFPAL